MLDRKIDLIEQDRFRLEAIGLLVTLFSADSFTYEIKLPLSAKSFINDGILGQYLISGITKKRFKKILKIFKIQTPDQKQKYNISKAFNEIFPSIGNQEDIYETNLLSGEKARLTSLSHYDFNWRLFIESVPKEFFESENLTEAIRRKIENLSYVYGLDELKMKDVLLKSLDEFGYVNIEHLSRNARYEYEASLATPEKEKRIEKPINRNTPADPLEYFRTISPIQLLEEIGERMVSVADLKTIERLIDEIGMHPTVVSVLIAYIARTKEGVLPGYSYFQKVAMSWKRNKIDSVEMAMDYVKHLETQKTNPKPEYKNKSKSKDVEVDWLEEYLKNVE